MGGDWGPAFGYERAAACPANPALFPLGMWNPTYGHERAATPFYSCLMRTFGGTGGDRQPLATSDRSCSSTRCSLVFLAASFKNRLSAAKTLFLGVSPATLAESTRQLLRAANVDYPLGM